MLIDFSTKSISHAGRFRALSSVRPAKRTNTSSTRRRHIYGAYSSESALSLTAHDVFSLSYLPEALDGRLRRGFSGKHVGDSSATAVCLHDAVVTPL